MAGNERAELEELRRLDVLEKRAGGGKPHPAAPSPMAEVAAETPEWERRAAAVGRSMSAPLEAAEQAREHITGGLAEKIGSGMQAVGMAGPKQMAKLKSDVAAKTGSADTEAQTRGRAMEELYKASPAARGTGIATDLTTGFLAPGVRAAEGAVALGRVGAGAATGAAYGAANPVTSGGNFTEEKGKQIGLGGLAGGGISAAVQGLLKIPGSIGWLVNKLTGPSATPAAKPVGEGAEKVTGELQRQRDVMEGKKPPSFGLSEYERTANDFERRMGQMRESAFLEQEPVKAKAALDEIAKLEAKNPDAKVRAALKEVRDTIGRASTGSTEGLPAAGARVTPAELRAMQGKGPQFSVEMADEVRQSIGRLIDQKGEAALDAHTKDVLGQVKEKLVGATPESYRRYLDQYTKGKADLDKYRPEQSATAALTSTERGADVPKGIDAQKHVAEELSGKDAGRNLSKMVRDTKHDPELLGGLRKSVSEWLIQRDAVGEIKTNEMLTRWRDSRDSIRDSGLFDKEHFESVDSLINQLKGAYSESATKKAVGSTLGWFIGGGYKGSYLGRHIAGKMADRVENDLEQRIVNAAMDDPQVAAALAGKETPESISIVERALSVSGGRKEGEQKPKKPKREPNPLGMRPASVL